MRDVQVHEIVEDMYAEPQRFPLNVDGSRAITRGTSHQASQRVSAIDLDELDLVQRSHIGTDTFNEQCPEPSMIVQVATHANRSRP
jgi:hypothetical protein